jgi:putative transposase
MPSRNLSKLDIENSYYHIYNRGVEKRIIFQDEQDYKVFLGYLKEYLSPPPDPKDVAKTFTLQGTTFKGVARQPNNYFQKIELTAYCLLPNHFHLLIKQIIKGTMAKFMKSIATRYSMYFNKKYNRVGSLFQNIYKAVNISDETYLLHLSRYIHLNPLEYTKDLTKAYSSYAEYLGQRKTSWIKPEVVLQHFDKANTNFFKRTNSYKKFVEDYNKKDQITPEGLDKLTLEN